MAVTPTSGVDASRIDLTPPVGSLGLPLTLLLADHYDDTLVGSAGRKALFDESIHAARPTGSGTALSPSPVVPSAILDESGVLMPPTPSTVHTMTPRAPGLTITTSPPRLNHETGALEFGQAVGDVSRSYHDADEVRSSIPFSRISISEPGRFTPQHRRRYSSGRPGNHTWNQTKTTDDDVEVSIDRTWGSVAASGTFDCSVASWAGGPRIEAITHYAAADLPSAGLGVSWGDAHDATFLTTLTSAPLHFDAESNGVGIAVKSDDLTFSSHWSLNLGVRQPVLASGCSVSSPDTTPTTVTTSEDVDSKDLLGVSESIQAVLVRDAWSDGTAAPETEATHPLGRVDLGNHVVADSCGLIGYEGVISATAFFQVSRNSDPDQVQGAVSFTDDMTYAGLNIQVHSGTTLRRNGDPDLTLAPLPPFRYGSDGLGVDVMTDALKTSAHRSGSAFSTSIDANRTQFSTRRNTHSTSDVSLAIPLDGLGEVELEPGCGLFTQSQERADRLFGDVAKAGDSWAGASSLSSGWLADGIPTRVRIVPQVLGYEDVTVTPGGAKLAEHVDAQDITFRKPIVDYHVLVSVASRDDLVVSADTTPSNTAIGDPSSRNDPAPARLHANADFSDLPCTIYHGIVRINPETLEQVFVPITDVPSGYHVPDASMPATVMPRHTKMSDNERAAMGWGLHQVTPFRPLASRQWPRVPKLCATIEAGGAYQRGGVSHLWDADVFGGELFVGADIIDATDLAVETTHADGQPEFGVWGRGQIWPNGDPEPQMPPGVELLVFRYSPRLDPYHPGPKATSRSSNPVRDALAASSAGTGSVIDANTVYVSTMKTGYTISDERLLADSAWAVHDWVFPQLELMRYLGQENKGAVRHPKHSLATGSEVILHPTLHCSSLRIMDDGRMMMAAIHRDYIETTSDYPSADVGYPLNPDVGVTSCPPGYFLQDGQCVPIVGGSVADAGFVFDPLSGDQREGSDNPSPVAGVDTRTPSSDNFGSYPTWSKMVANTSSRSVMIAFTDAAANANGNVARGSLAFDVKWRLTPISDEDTELLALQTWTHEDTWWSGARISYWFDESGQRVIPITYGSYPECRASHATLPRTLPWLASDLSIKHGYPMLQPAISAAPLPAEDSLKARALAPVDAWAQQRLDFLTFSRFVPTTIGFADFGAGASPHQELGWSGWGFPTGLYDPIGYTNAAFFTDSTDRAKWTNFGDSQDDAASAYSPYAAVLFDCSNVSFPALLTSFIHDGVEMVIAPQLCANIGDAVTALLNPIHSLYAATIEPQFLPFGGALTSSGDLIIRQYQDTPSVQPTDVFTTDNVLKFSLLRFDTGDATISVARSTVGLSLLRGPFGGWSHFGPLHYGISSTHHPYRVDRVFKQVHGGVGYDLPLHLLVPGDVHARARAGGRGSVELEMETPFHRTDNLHLLGPAAFNTGFELGGSSPPGATRAAAGQFYLRTNLWDAPTTFASGSLLEGYTSNLQRIHGPLVSGSVGLEAFWSDHPTDHFHAAAMPILPGSDYDLALIETNRYAPVMLARRSEMHELDVLATSEQLASSVDVHVSQTARPFWDSGSIVSAQGVGEEDAMNVHVERCPAEQDIGNVPAAYTPYSLTNGSRLGLGKGQRILRTPEGTLHVFNIKRSVASGSNNYPTWTHMKKPLHSDLFFNRRSLKTSPDTATYDAKDECGPMLEDIGIDTQTSYRYRTRLHGAAYAADSNGTIHAVIEIHPNPNDATEHQAHRLYYTKADRVLVSANPEPVYDWDWSVHTPVLIQSHLTSNAELGGTRWDLRWPSLVCDSQDRLHLAVTQILLAPESDYADDLARVLYSTKLPDEASFPDFDPASGTGLPVDERWSAVSANILDAATDTNEAANSSHATLYAYYPKVCLRSDDVPVVSWMGSPGPSYATTARRPWAIYTNIGEGGVGGTFTFDVAKAIHVCGVGPDSRNTLSTYSVRYFDVIVDERDRAAVVTVKNDSRTASGQTFANRQTLLTVFDTRIPLADQYSTTDGLGDTRTIFMGPTYDGSTELRYTDTYFENPTITTNGRGEYHLVMGFTMTGEDPSRMGATFRDSALLEESALGPLQWPSVPISASGSTLYDGGYAEPTATPNWSGITSSSQWYSQETVAHRHLMHVWIPAVEFDDDTGATDRVIRSLNVRWLSVPSLRFDSTKGWVPIGSAQTLAGNEDFPHLAAQVRYQRFWGYDASEIDLRWLTNELSWFRTPHAGSALFMPGLGGADFRPGGGETSGEGIPGFPSGV